MTATMSKPTLETTIHNLVRMHYSSQGSNLAASKAEVADQYWKRAIREGLAAILFQHRGDSLPRFKTIPLIYESDVNAILRKHETDFVHGSGAEKPIVLDAIYQELIEFAVPQELIATDEEERRRLVLAGEEPALHDDAKWINDLVEQKRQEADELIAILQGRKVNRPPKDALLRCTLKECLGLPDHRRSLHENVMRDAGRPIGQTMTYDGECERCANSGVGACDDAPHPKRPESEAARSKTDD